MINIKIITYKHGLFWYSCCQIPFEGEADYAYYDNAPFMVMKSPLVLHARAFSKSKSIEKLKDKINKRFEKKGG